MFVIAVMDHVVRVTKYSESQTIQLYVEAPMYTGLEFLQKVHALNVVMCGTV
jgi:hypothetical protein